MSNPRRIGSLLYRQPELKDASDAEKCPSNSPTAASASSSPPRFFANSSPDSSKRGQERRNISGSNAWPSSPAILSSSSRREMLPISHRCDSTGCTDTIKDPKPVHESHNGNASETSRGSSSPPLPRSKRGVPSVSLLDSPTDTGKHLMDIFHFQGGNGIKTVRHLATPRPPRSKRGDPPVSLVLSADTDKHHKAIHDNHIRKKFKAAHPRPTSPSVPSEEETQESLTPTTQPTSLAIDTQPRAKGESGRQEGSQLSSDSKTAKKPTEFTLFLRLPIELRLMIWSLALPGPRVIEILCKEDAERDFYTKSKPPILLHVCQESREHALKVFQEFRAQNSISRDTEHFMHNSVEVQESLIEDQYDGTVVVHEAKPVHTYINYRKDLLYVSLGSYNRRGGTYAGKINDFLSDVDEDDAAEIRCIGLEPPHNPFNEILQTLSTKFSKLETCGGVTSDPCASHPDPNVLKQWNSAPHFPAVGFEEVELEPGETYKSRRWNPRTDRVEEVDTHLTVEKFEERTAELRKAAKQMGIDEAWIDNLEFPAIEIEREGP